MLLNRQHNQTTRPGGAVHAGRRQSIPSHNIASCAEVMHELDAPYLEVGDHEVTAASWYGSRLEACVVDRKLAGSEEDIHLGKRIILAVHIPGHSPGSVAYITTSDSLKIVFARMSTGHCIPHCSQTRPTIRPRCSG